MSRESVSITEAATMLDVSRWTIWRLLKEGKLTAFRVRNCKRIPLKEIQNFRRANIVNVAEGSTR
jgi:excisionase family DNA binding protein